MKPNWREMAFKWRGMCDCNRVTIGHLERRMETTAEIMKYKEAEIMKLQKEIDELRLKYSTILAYNIRLLEKIKALTEAKYD